MDMTMLKEHLGDELYARVEEKLGELEDYVVIAAHDGSWLPKGRLDAEIAKRRELQTAIASLSGELEEARQKAAENSNMQAEVERLAREMAERDRTIAGLRRSEKIREALQKANARDVGLVERLLDGERMGEDEAGNLTGVEEQIRALKESSAYLFFDAPSAGQKAGFGGGKSLKGGGSAQHADVNGAIRAAAGRY